ncbi:MAG: hypothetical protein J0L77_00375 [Alphaproteobacteria bacterium]|nr:hypothetical protein [Alphaproteobacteria bacterium]
MKTNYINIVKQLVLNLENALKIDMGIPKNRHYCSGNMFGAYYAMSSVEEKEFATCIMNTGSDLDPLETDHPRRSEEIEEYKDRLREVINYLKTYLPDAEENLEKSRCNNEG